MEQRILTAENDYEQLDAWLREKGGKKIFLVAGRSLASLKLGKYFDTLESRLGIGVVRFSGFAPNPTYESVTDAVDNFRASDCDAIVAVGGGSAMDVAKCVKLFYPMTPGKLYFKQPMAANDLPLLAVPTTAGTGSESNRFAVFYYQGEKQSLASEACIPEAVLFDPDTLKTLPDYHKKATMLDTFCHAIESYWSVNSTAESRAFAFDAITTALDNLDGYLAGEDAGLEGMLKAANLAGKAINLTQTTAGHAMCYKLTTNYGLAHGHAAALCVKALWPWMLEHSDRCREPRGEAFLRDIFSELAVAMGSPNLKAGAKKFGNLVDRMDLGVPTGTEAEIGAMVAAVNPDRLKNNPVKLSPNVISALYHQIVRVEE